VIPDAFLNLNALLFIDDRGSQGMRLVHRPWLTGLSI
jgi:hypothetical protein